MPEKKDKLSFEKAITELEQIIENLESDELTLDNAVSNFEKGIGLLRICESHLKSTEGKLKELLKGEHGELVERVLGRTIDSLTAGDDSHE